MHLLNYFFFYKIQRCDWPLISHEFARIRMNSYEFVRNHTNWSYEFVRIHTNSHEFVRIHYFSCQTGWCPISHLFTKFWIKNRFFEFFIKTECSVKKYEFLRIYVNFQEILMWIRTNSYEFIRIYAKSLFFQKKIVFLSFIKENNFFKRFENLKWNCKASKGTVDIAEF